MYSWRGSVGSPGHLNISRIFNSSVIFMNILGIKNLTIWKLPHNKLLNNHLILMGVQ